MNNKNVLRKTPSKVFRLLLILAGTLLAMVLLFALFLFAPLNTRSLVSKPHPAQDYAESLQRIEGLQKRESPMMNPECYLRFMDHGKTVDQVIVFIHGYTSCPKQFASLGDTFYDLGYNVLILPLPHHGLANRMTNEHAWMTAEELVAYADTTVDIAQGLGEHVRIVGFSAGGAVAAWAAQTRSEIDFAVLVSPSFGFLEIPTPLTLPATRLTLLLPNSYRWWVPNKMESGGLAHAYPRIATRALAQLLRLGFAVRVRARQTAPQADSILIVTNGNEPSVNNALTDELAQVWIGHGAQISQYEFGKELGLPHDLIDPEDPYGHPEIVYPILIPLLKH